ncbi:unnamed protein product, partial [Effrenium voratum]
GFPGASVPWSSTDVLSPDEEAELEALRSEAAQLRQEALQNAAAEGLERKVELLQREFRLAVEERQRLAKQLRPQRLVEETTGKEQAMISAKRLLVFSPSKQLQCATGVEPSPPAPGTSDSKGWRAPPTCRMQTEPRCGTAPGTGVTLVSVLTQNMVFSL